MSNRRRLRAAPGDLDPHTPHGRVLRAPALLRREPTVEELVLLSGLGYDVVTGPRPIVAVETSEGMRWENLHRTGWPEACGCGTSICSGEADR